MSRFIAAIMFFATTCPAASDPERCELSEGDIVISFLPPKQWAGAKCTSLRCEFYPGKTFKNVGLAIEFSDLRSEDFSHLPETDRWVFEQDSLAEQYLKRERNKGSDQSGIALEPALGTHERRIRVYLNVSSNARFLSFIPRARHVVEVCMFANSVTDLARHKQTYLRFLESIHVRPNQSLQPAAARCAFTLFMIKTVPENFSCAPGSRR